MTAAPDKSLERYEIVDRIAVGGMAEVFRAKAFGAHGFEKTLAIKRILPDLASDSEFEDRFIQEAKLAVQLAHANIVQVFDFGRFGGTLFIAMEHVDGLDLAHLLKAVRKRGEQLPVGAALHIAIELCKGLDFAHQRGVVHRDVSPSNVLLSRSGEVKIADFGIAQAERDHVPSGKQKRIMGKFRYMSPEQARGEDLHARSDLFSAAVVMYELFTGQKLFGGEDAQEVLDNIQALDIPRLSTVRTELPPKLDDVLAKALARDPSGRPERAAEIQRALTEVSYESSIVASAFEVADVVASVLGERREVAVSAGGGKRGIDDLIRQQMGNLGEVGKMGSEPTELDVDRRTEEASLLQTQTTFVRKGTDADGSTMWELDDAQTIAAVPSAIRGERSGAAGRVTGSNPTLDRTNTSTADVTPIAAGRGLIPWLIAGVVALGAGGFVLFGGGDSGGRKAAVPLAGQDGGPTVVAVAADAGPAMGKLDIRTTPPGARVILNGTALEGVTPMKVPVSASEVYRVSFELEGYRTFQYSTPITVDVGTTLLLPGTLEPLRAGLTVRTRPPGAEVYRGDELLGTTPLTRDDLTVGTGVELTIKKDDYKTEIVSVDLIDGNEAEVTRTLKSTIAYGAIRLTHPPGTEWAEVFLGGKKLGRAPTESLRIPVGKHTLVLKNPHSGHETTLRVTVVADEVKSYKFKLGS